MYSCKLFSTYPGNHVHTKDFQKKSFAYTGCPKKLHLILGLNFGAVHFSMTKMLVLPDSRDMYKSFGT